MIKAAILSPLLNINQSSWKCEGRPEQNGNADEILFMCPHSHGEKEECVFNCCEPLIINKIINIHKKIQVSIHVQDFLMPTSFIGLKWVLFHRISDFTLLVSCARIVFLLRSKFAKN